MNLIISHTYTPMTKDPREQAVATSEDIARAKAAAAAERVRAIEQVPELRRYFISAHPLRPSRVALDTRAACQDALDSVVEQFTLSLVLRCLAMTCAANNIDVARKTIDELAEGAEEQ